MTNLQSAPPALILRQANQAMSDAKERLAHCYGVFQKCLSGLSDLDIYALGQLKAHIWELEQIFGHKHIYFSAAGQDEYIYETYFKNKPDGVYLEIGGYNGWRGSNCYFFEKTLHWKGAIVEASPFHTKEISKYRDAQIINAAITDINGKADFIEVLSGKTQMSGLSRYYLQEKLNGVRAYPGHKEQKVEIETMTLGRLLDSLQFKSVDYCSIDVEGAERSILSGFDFKSYDIKIFSIENALGNASQSVRDILVPAGYTLVTVIGDDEIYAQN